MKALGPQRLRIVLYFFLQLLLTTAFCVGLHLKARMVVMLPCALGIILFGLLGLRGRYNL